MADSYYIVIRGKKYDRRMIELANGLTKGKGDGRISVNDAKNLLRVVKDSNSYSAIEKATMEYIRKRYKFTKEGDEYFRGEIRKWAGGKGKKKTAKDKKSQPGIAASIPEPAAVATQPTATTASSKTSSPWKEIFLGTLLLALLSAAFYFFAYKSSCAKPVPVTNAPPAPKPAEPAGAPAKPAEAVPTPPPVSAEQPKKVTASTDLEAFVKDLKVSFIAEKAEIGPNGNKRLDDLAKRLKSENTRILVTGHTCSLGPAELNQRISEKRAQVVKDALVARGVKAERIEIKGVAASEPIGDNKAVAGRVANRRVTFKIIR